MSSKIFPGDGTAGQPVSWAPLSFAAVDLPRHGIPPRNQGSSTEAAVEQRIRETEADAGRRIEEAHRRGFQEGESAGRTQGAKQWEAALDRLSRAVAEIAGLRTRFHREAEDDAVRLSLAVARRILHRDLTVNPEAILGLVKAALEQLDAREVHRLRLHPDGAAIVSRRLNELGLPIRVEVIADPSFEPGAVVFETTRGQLDASIETQLDEIGHGFADLLGHSS
ncbi:MAG TPA: FliH/SctL family protein [Bryobacteraceae bacterium]|nr:FliH/SctL family protein [Bryobacteraceae bacterium]